MMKSEMATEARMSRDQERHPVGSVEGAWGTGGWPERNWGAGTEIGAGVSVALGVGSACGAVGCSASWSNWGGWLWGTF